MLTRVQTAQSWFANVADFLLALGRREFALVDILAVLAREGGANGEK
jgi:hypothetical protein